MMASPDDRDSAADDAAEHSTGPDDDAEPWRVSSWTREHARRLSRTAATDAPIIYPPAEPRDPDHHIWDTWFLRDRQGRVTDLDGWRVAFSLTAPTDLLPGKRHDVATIRYYYSRDGHDWQRGGEVFDPERSFGSRQWAGSALLDDDGSLYLYYTASGRANETDLTYEQRLAVGYGGTVTTAEDGVTLDGPWTHEVLLEADGDIYQAEAQSQSGHVYTFRDPWFFEDPNTGRTFLVFEANTNRGDRPDDPEVASFDGCVALAESPTGDPLDWERRPPILDAVGVNQELERPHVVVRDDRYYLFVSSHEFTFAPGLPRVEGLFGFAADCLTGDYEPLNDSGLVVANPANAPYQGYSWVVTSHGDDLLAHSFFNYFDLRGRDLDAVADLPEPRQFETFGGTPAPTLRIGLDADENRTWIRDALDHGVLPPDGADLGDPAWERRPDRHRQPGGEY